MSGTHHPTSGLRLARCHVPKNKSGRKFCDEKVGSKPRGVKNGVHFYLVMMNWLVLIRIFQRGGSTRKPLEDGGSISSACMVIWFIENIQRMYHPTSMVWLKTNGEAKKLMMKTRKRLNHCKLLRTWWLLWFMMLLNHVNLKTLWLKSCFINCCGFQRTPSSFCNQLSVSPRLSGGDWLLMIANDCRSSIHHLFCKLGSCDQSIFQQDQSRSKNSLQWHQLPTFQCLPLSRDGERRPTQPQIPTLLQQRMILRKERLSFLHVLRL